MNFRQIEAFRAVMLTGGITKAAHAMNITQPAVSRLLKDFAAQTGIRLFERDGAGLRPTEEAHLLFEEVDRAYAGMDSIMRAALRIRHKEQADLSIMAVSAVAMSVIPEMIQFFRARQRQPHFLIDTASNQEIVAAARRSTACLGVVELPVEPDQLAIERLPATRAVAILPKGHPLATRSRITPADFHAQDCIALPGHLLHRMKLDKIFAEHGVQPRIVAQARSSMVAARLVALGVGISVLDPFVAATLAGQLECRALDFALDHEYAIVHNVQKRLSRHERHVCEYLHERFLADATPAFAGGATSATLIP